MTATSTVPLAPALLAHPDIRDANTRGMALAVLTPDLSAILWANSAGARFFDLSAAGPVADEVPLPATPSFRQLRASRRILERGGEAKLALRGRTGAAGGLLPATLKLVDGAPLGHFALASIALDPAAENEKPICAADILAEAGPGLAAIRSCEDATAREGSEALLTTLPSAEAVDDFLQGDEALRTFEDAGRPGVLARLAQGAVLVWVAGGEVDRHESETGSEESSDEGAAVLSASHDDVPHGGSNDHDADEASAMVDDDRPDEPVAEVTSDLVAKPRTCTQDAAPGHDEPSARAETSELESEESDVSASQSADRAPVRFVWRIDNDGVFRSLSPELELAVGKRSAAIVGRSFEDVAEDLGLDPDGSLALALEKRTTWSGRTVDWPVDGSSLRVPVDLAALPVYARDRSFDGFRGFGVARVSEAAEVVREPAAALEDDHDLPLDAFEAADTSPAFSGPHDTPAWLQPADRGAETERVFGRREAPVTAETGDAPATKVIRLEERRRPRDVHLSRDEEEAFLAIGETLGEEERVASLDKAVRRATRLIEEIEPHTPSQATADNDASEDARIDDEQLVGELATVYRSLPLPVLVQHHEVLVYGNREFFDLTGDESIDALNDRGGLASLFVEIEERSPDSGEVTLSRATGETLSVRTHLQRSTIAGKSCLVMSFYASPSVSAAAIRFKASPPSSDASPAGEDIFVAAPATTSGVTAIEPAAIERELEDMRVVLATATSGVVFLDSDGLIRSMNEEAERLFALPTGDIAGRPFLSLFAHESQKAAAEYLEASRRNPSHMAGAAPRELIGRVAEGRFVPLAVTFGKLNGARGWCAVMRDVSHSRQAEQERETSRRDAEAASLQKSQFLANVSHELRTPLNAIIGFADVIASESFGPIGNERYLEYLGDIKRSGHHVLDLVNDLLDISKIEAGKLELRFDAVSLTEIVGDVVALMQPQANREQVIVRSNLPSSVPPVVADSRSVRQITMNLVSNAIRFTPRGGQIIVSTGYDPDGAVVLRFRDSGIGMSEEEIAIAMLPFQQINPSQFRRGEGTGLGLPLTKALVEANRGEFSISSTPGEGTLVEITFPPNRVLAD